MALGLGLVDLSETVMSGREGLAREYDTNSLFSRCAWVEPFTNVEASPESGFCWDTAP